MKEVKFKALTFDDVLLLPRYTDFLPSEAQLKTRLSRNIDLALPILSAAMDTVTETKMAIAMAEIGAIGIVHKNNSCEEQCYMVRAVKKYVSGIIREPVTISSKQSIAELRYLIKDFHFTGMPVVDAGTLQGIVTRRDFSYAEDPKAPVSSIMTPRDRLITAPEGTALDEIRTLMHRHRIEKVILVDARGELQGLVTMKDIETSINFPDATKDHRGRLRVGAAIGTGREGIERAEALREAGVDVLVLDSAHGHSQNVLNTLEELRRKCSELDIIGGNVATPEGALALQKTGIDAIKIGMGPGSICSTRIIAGIGVPQISAILNIKKALKNSVTPLIADGGIRFSGDIAKAIAAGADSVMLGGVLAGTDESSGDFEFYNGRSYKVYRGMGSLEAMTKRSDKNRYFQDAVENKKIVPEGVEGRVPYRGKTTYVIQQLMGGLRQSMGYVGCRSIREMKEKAEFIEITKAGINESHVHNVEMTKEAPNYQLTPGR